MSGMRGINPRQMKQAMRKMGITNESIDAYEVVIKCKDKELVISNPDVVAMTMQGSTSYQITGEVSERQPGESTASVSFPEEDIELVISQTNCDRAKAIEALEACEGQPAEAILKIMTE